MVEPGGKIGLGAFIGESHRLLDGGLDLAFDPTSSSAVMSSSLSDIALKESMGSRVRHWSTSSEARYADGSDIEWPRNLYVMASRNTGPLPSRTRLTASVMASRTASTSMPSICAAGILYDSAAR